MIKTLTLCQTLVTQNHFVHSGVYLMSVAAKYKSMWSNQEKHLIWQDKAKQQMIEFHTQWYFAWSDQTLMLHCQIHTSSCCPLMVLALLMLTSSSAAHSVRFTVWFPPGLADTPCPAQRNYGSVWWRGNMCDRKGRSVQVLGQNITFVSLMLRWQMFKNRI